ncbi:hypothetical protein LSAJ156_140004 [Latilactobacillus sakei]|nr:hypothetical protein LSAJ156_140004 [Latilactobacillus sakei]SON72596.1 protein of unknown function [Latilactobacillus sakei]
MIKLFFIKVVFLVQLKVTRVDLIANLC